MAAMAMRVVSVNVGLPRTVEWRGKPVSTGIFKEPVAGRVAVRYLNLDGDRQADLSVHGGPDKAIYAYPAEHYPFWRDCYPDHDLRWAAFGENLTIAGLREDAVRIGDRFRVGTAELMAVQPRFPCFKLGIRFGDPHIVKRFRESDRPGIYFRVMQEGNMGAGDTITRIEQAPYALSVVDLARLVMADTPDPDAMHGALAVAALPENLRDHFTRQLAEQPA